MLFFIALYFSSYIQISNMQVFSNKLSSFPFLDSKSVHIRNTIPKSQIQKRKWSYFLLLFTLVLTYKYQICRSSPINFSSFFSLLTYGRLKWFFLFMKKWLYLASFMQFSFFSSFFWIYASNCIGLDWKFIV